MTSSIRFFKYIKDRGRHVGAEHIFSVPHQSPGDHSDSKHASKWNFIHNATLVQLLKSHCFIFNELYLGVWLFMEY